MSGIILIKGIITLHPPGPITLPKDQVCVNIHKQSPCQISSQAPGTPQVNDYRLFTININYFKSVPFRSTPDPLLKENLIYTSSGQRFSIVSRFGPQGKIVQRFEAQDIFFGL